MDDEGHRGNGRYKTDHYKSINGQWMMSQHLMKDHRSATLMAIIAERDNSVQQRNLARSEKETAIAERDQAILALKSAITDRNEAILEREEAFRALENARKNSTCASRVQGCGPGCSAPHGMKHIHPHELQLQPHRLSDAPYDHESSIHVSDTTSISVLAENAAKVRRYKHPMKDLGAQTIPSKKVVNSPRKRKQGNGEVVRVGEDLNKQVKHQWKNQNLGLNQITFDDTTMPVPVCSCTGTFRQCYKWGDGGWQSSCCTTNLSLFPLPMAPNKRHSRVGGRKMSGSAFRKLLGRLLAEGCDLSNPLDLRDHWARHGTNRYITIK